MTESYDGREVVGMDLHRQRSVLVRMTEDGRRLETARITNSAAELRRVIGMRCPGPSGRGSIRILIRKGTGSSVRKSAEVFS